MYELKVIPLQITTEDIYEYKTEFLEECSTSMISFAGGA